jgi:hypothetical protein
MRIQVILFSEKFAQNSLLSCTGFPLAEHEHDRGYILGEITQMVPFRTKIVPVPWKRREMRRIGTIFVIYFGIGTIFVIYFGIGTI